MLKPDQKLFLDENNSGYTSMYLRLYCSQVRKRTKTIKFLVIPRNVVLMYIHVLVGLGLGLFFLMYL